MLLFAPTFRLSALNPQLSTLSVPSYLGRLAPSPTGYLHLGHARTFWVAQERARAAGGTLVLRNDDLDATRFRLDFVDAMLEDLRWLGFQWQGRAHVGRAPSALHPNARPAPYCGALPEN